MRTLFRKITPALLALFALNAVAVTRYVDLNSSNPLPPYTNWFTAATNIQDAVDVAVDGDLVLVTNGVYQTGGRAVFGTMTNRVAVDKPLMLLSVNGPQFTIIQGYQVSGTTNGDGAIRGVYLTGNSTLSGFTVLNGATQTNGDFYHDLCGGGIWSETNALTTNCMILGNVAAYGGGGAYGGNLNASTFVGNSAPSEGGGALRSVLIGCNLKTNSSNIGGGSSQSILSDCTLIGNRAFYSGGAASFGSLTNCNVIMNSADEGSGGVFNSILSHCLISSNSGGGASGSWLYDCSIIANSGHNGAGGAAGGRLIRCTVSNNWTTSFGGGVADALVSQCVIVSNTAGTGGGLSGCSVVNSVVVGNSAYNSGGGTDGFCSLLNCIVYYNSAPLNENTSGDTITYSCTWPLPFGSGNFTNPPLFMDKAIGDFRLQPDSPCINAGGNVSYLPITNTTDMIGNMRISGGTIDVGAYEFQSPASALSYAWAQQYGLPIDGTADFADGDGDGANNWQESRADTIPTNAISVLRMVSVNNEPSGITVTWQSVGSRNYWLERATNLNSQTSFQPVNTFIMGFPGTTTYTDTTATAGGSYFYRVGVQ